jgi:hypothetical protein
VQPGPSLTDRPRHVPAVVGTPGIPVDNFRALLGILGFRRAFLDQKHGEDHIGGHLEVFALPVLRQRLPERAAGRVLAEREFWLLVCLSVGVILTDSALDPDAFSHGFARIAKAAGLEGVRLHDARHGVATMLAKAGTPAYVTSKVLGHSSVHFTANTYTHADEEMVDRALAGLEQLFGALSRSRRYEREGIFEAAAPSAAPMFAIGLQTAHGGRAKKHVGHVRAGHVVGRRGIEPRTIGLKVRCSAN